VAGIVSYGAYVPPTRLGFGVMAGKPAKGEEQTPERAVAWADEDAVTMAVAAATNALRGFDRASVEETLRALADRLGIESGELIHPSRVALTGKTVSPDIFWVIVLLGRSKTVERLRSAAAMGGTGAPRE